MELRLGALLPGVEGDDEEAGVRAGGAVDEPVAGDGEEVGDAGDLFDGRIDLVQDLAGALERGPVGELDIDDAVAFVLLRDKAGRETAEAENGEDNEPAEKEQGEDGPADGETGDAEVTVRDFVEPEVEDPEKAARLFRLLTQ